MNKNKMLEKAYRHFYSMRMTMYIPKENLINIYSGVIRGYCCNNGCPVTESEVRNFLYDKLMMNDSKQAS